VGGHQEGLRRLLVPLLQGPEGGEELHLQLDQGEGQGPAHNRTPSETRRTRRPTSSVQARAISNSALARW